MAETVLAASASPWPSAADLTRDVYLAAGSARPDAPSAS